MPQMCNLTTVYLGNFLFIVPNKQKGLEIVMVNDIIAK